MTANTVNSVNTASTVRDRAMDRLRVARGAARRLRPPGTQRRGTPTPTRPERLLMIPLFGDLSASEAAILSLFMTRLTADEGEVIVREGGQDCDLYLIEEGQAAVQIAGQGQEAGPPTTLATLGPGEYFGEIGYLTGEQRTADVVALTPMTLLRLSPEGYDVLAQLAALEELTRTAQHRSQETRERRQAARER